MSTLVVASQPPSGAGCSTRFCGVRVAAVHVGAVAGVDRERAAGHRRPAGIVAHDLRPAARRRARCRRTRRRGGRASRAVCGLDRRRSRTQSGRRRPCTVKVGRVGAGLRCRCGSRSWSSTFGVPSPKSHSYVSAPPSGSVAVPVNWTCSGAPPSVGLAAALAVGSRVRARCPCPLKRIWSTSSPPVGNARNSLCAPGGRRDRQVEVAAGSPTRPVFGTLTRAEQRPGRRVVEPDLDRAAGSRPRRR